MSIPRISIVIITFNSRSFIKPCLGSLFAQISPAFEVIVVDNGSEDQTISCIEQNYGQIKILKQAKNLGASFARNQGIEASCGEWILTLDCDVILEPDFLSQAENIISNLNSQVGILQPKILNFDKKTIYSCGIYLSYLRRFYDIGKRRNDNHSFSNSRYIFGACSACALYNRKMLNELKEDMGYFDERFFFLVEDVDLAWRAQKKGWRTLFCPQIISHHKGNSSQTPRKIRQYLCFRNRKLMIKKNESSWGKLRLFILGFWYDFFRYFYLICTNKYLIKGIPKNNNIL